MSRLYTDNARSLFGAGIGTTDLTFTCATGLGVLFPSPTGNDYFVATFESLDKTKLEKVKVIAKNTDTFSIAVSGRAIEGTTAQTWTTADSINIRWTSSSNSTIVQSMQFNAPKYSLDTGTASAYVVTLDPSPVSYASGLEIVFKAANQNTGTCTINANAIGPIAIKKFGSVDLSPGDILASQIVTLVYDGTFFQVISQISSERAGRIELDAGSTAPIGWLLCDGSAISRTSFAALFARIGTVYGSGNGSTTFNIPDLRGRVPVGAGPGVGLTNRVLASTGGEENHVLSVSELAPHTHPELTVGGANAVAWQSYYQPAVSAGGTSTTTGSTGSGSGHNTMQPFLTLNYIIKA